MRYSLKGALNQAGIEEYVKKILSHYDQHGYGLWGLVLKETGELIGIAGLIDQIVDDITLFLHDLIDGNKRNLVVAPNTKMSFSISRIYAHRFFGFTNCYGTFLSDSWARDLLVQFKPVPNNVIKPLKERLRLVQKIMQLLIQLRALLIEQKMKEKAFGSVGDRECEGFINQ